MHNHLEVMPHSKFSGVSGCSDAVSQGSAGSTRSTELVLGIIDSADGFSEPFLLLANLDQVISDIILCLPHSRTSTNVKVINTDSETA